MVFQESIHYPDAEAQIMSNHGNLRNLQIIERGAKKWEITKTLIRTTPNGFQYPCYLDKNNNCVYYNSWMGGASDFPLIGEVEYTEEEITVWHKLWEKDDEENN